ncbi:unnamed protein product [Rotaria sp. Silwood2]|nr:unnamed protein product [Rotaria sp. Silwood2]
MSWIVEQSDNTSAVQVNGNAITCTKEGYYDSPINVMYDDPADHNGQYFWELKFIESATETGSSAVGLTIKQAFQPGYMLKAMKYLGD